MRGRQRTYHHEPTNKEMKRGVQGLADTMPKKGHLTNQERKPGDKQSVLGVLVHIVKARIDSNGWVVDVGTGKDKVRYECINGQSTLSIPESTVTDTLYVPKEKTEAYINIDKKSKIYTLTRIIGDVIPLATYGDTLTISPNTNEKDNADIQTSIVMTKDIVKINAKAIVIQDAEENTVDLTQQSKDIEELKENNENLEQKNQELTEQNADLIKRIEIIEDSIKNMTEEDTEEDTDEEDTESE